MSQQQVVQTLGHYAHGQRVRLLSDTASFRIRLPGGRHHRNGCVWCYCDPDSGEIMDSDDIDLEYFSIHRAAANDDAQSAQTSQFTIKPRQPLPPGKTFSLHFRYDCPASGVRSWGRDARYRVTVFYASS